MNEKIVPVVLLAIREGRYTMYVFKNTETNEYIMCTKLPNWQTPEIFVGDAGFLQLQIVKAGDEYFNVNTESNDKYRYCNIYFKNFVSKTGTIGSEIIL